MLIALSENLLVNAEAITAVEIREVRDKKHLIVYVGDKMFTATVSPQELLMKLNSMGVNSFEGHFAG